MHGYGVSVEGGGRKVTKSYNSHAAMYVCTFISTSPVAGSICSWILGTAGQIEAVYRHHPTSSAFVGAQIVYISCTVLGDGSVPLLSSRILSQTLMYLFDIL